jgi:hypothetical protein
MHPMQYAGLDVQPAADRVAAPGRDGRRRYRTWQSLGRQVRRGAKGIGIFGYSTKTTVQEVTDDAGKADEKATTRTFYPVRTVFDISDTDGDDIGLPTEVDSARNPHPNASDKAYRRVSTWLTGQGWDVQRVDITGATRGYTDHTEKLVRVAAHLDHINAARVLLHVILHGPDSDFITNEQYAASRTHRGTAEIQADGAAFVLADLLGPDTEQASVGYSQAGPPPRRAPAPTPTRSLQRSAGPRPPSCTRSTPSPRRSAWTTDVQPAGLPRPLPSRAGPPGGSQRPLPWHPGRHHPLPATATTQYPPPRPAEGRGGGGGMSV